MKCQRVKDRLHEYLDYRLRPAEMAEVGRHLQDCAGCQQRYEELSWLRGLLAGRERMPEVAEEQLWKRLQQRVHWSFPSWCLETWDRVRTFWRDLDRELVWSKITAVPITLTFFFMILFQFSPVQIQELTYQTVWVPRVSMKSLEEPLIRQVSVRQQRTGLDGLMDTAWRIPFEDQLSLVAEVTPEGHAEIENVLEYPKSHDLLKAVDHSLRQSEFQVPSFFRPFVIYSFQKIDVYEDSRGL